MTDIQKAGPRDPRSIERVWLQQQAIKGLKRIADDHKAALHNMLQDGESLKVVNARGGELGTVYRTKAKQQAVIEDKAEALADAQDRGAEIEDLLPVEGSPNYWHAVDVLKEHAPHLLRVEILDHEVKRLAEEVLAEYHETGEVRPGWRISEGKGGYTAVRASDLGKRIAETQLNSMLGILELEKGNEDGEV